MKRLTKYLGVLLVALTATSVHAIPIQDLFNGGSIQVGDKLFSDWTKIQQTDVFVGDPMDLGLIEVTGIGDGTVGNEYGLSFAGNGQWAAEDDFLDLYFGFSVTALDPTMSIVGVSMSGTTIHRGEEILVLVEKFVYDNAVDFNELAFIDIVNDQLLGDVYLGNSAGFGGQSSVWVEDNILVDGFAGFAELASFQQRFLQEAVSVPEPGTLALLGIGLLGMAASRRRRKS